MQNSVLSALEVSSEVFLVWWQSLASWRCGVGAWRGKGVKQGSAFGPEKAEGPLSECARVPKGRVHRATFVSTPSVEKLMPQCFCLRQKNRVCMQKANVSSCKLVQNFARTGDVEWLACFENGTSTIEPVQGDAPHLGCLLCVFGASRIRSI